MPLKEAVLCHDCLIKYMNEILYNRVILFIKSNFTCIEFFTRPIKINTNIKINYTLYKYITKSCIINDFENILNNICFNCYKYIPDNNLKEKIIKLKCRCQLCQFCIKEKFRENNNGYEYLNPYELHSFKCNKCFCGLNYQLKELFKYSIKDYSDKDIKQAQQRLSQILSNNCCICVNNSDKTDYIKLNVGNSPIHFICNNCHKKNILEKQKVSKTNNDINNIVNDFESSDSALRGENENDKKVFCNICDMEHIIIP